MEVGKCCVALRVMHGSASLAREEVSGEGRRIGETEKVCLGCVTGRAGRRVKATKGWAEKEMKGAMRKGMTRRRRRYGWHQR